MKENLKLTIGIGLMTFGAIILTVSIVVSAIQNIGKEKAIREFEEGRTLFNKGLSLNDSEPEADETAKSGNEDAEHKDLNSSDDGVDVSEADRETEAKEIFTGYLVRIPKIDCTEPVKEGTTRSALAASLGHETGTAMPGETGNCVIAGHRNYNFGKYFNRLDEVEIGDTIYVDTVDDTYEYTVEEIKVVEPTDLSVLENTEEEILTLYTCTPIYIATHRLVIIAKRVNI